MERAEWIELLILSSIPVRQLNDLRMPINFASGCFVDYCGKRMLLTVAHATGNQKEWNIEIKSSAKVGTAVYPLGKMSFLAVANVWTSEVEYIDFSYKLVPNDLISYHHDINEKGQVVNQKARKVLTIDFSIIPDADRRYGFFGQTEFSQNGFMLHSNSKLVTDLRFVGAEGHYYKFKLPIEHPGHHYFRGASGAPIIDDNGNVVALVCHGEKDGDFIYGIALKHFKHAIDIEVSD